MAKLGPSIGELRWVVTLATRVQAPDGTTGISESYTNMVQTYAQITPIGLQTWLGSEQIDSPITHRIIIRYQDNIHFCDTVLREIHSPDGNPRQEIYRVRRVSEMDGRQRFVVIEAEVERRSE